MELYKQSGVDIEAGYEAVKRIRSHTQRTFIPGVMGGIGGFGGNFDLSAYGFREPVLVSGTDGVGTKLKLAFAMDKHDTIGVDAVAMCVNDVVVQGAKPLFFLDYLAVGKNDPVRIEQIVKGVADGCVLAGCGLIGGETAEMPSMYEPNEYDIAGFCVGAVEKANLIDGKKIRAGQAVIGMASSGVHSNGFSLVRKIVTDQQLDWHQPYEAYFAETLGEVFLKPTNIYVKAILDLLNQVEVKGMSHITGGGFYENVPRMFSDAKLGVVFDQSSWQKPSVFSFLMNQGKVSEQEMFSVFNMGIGFMVVVDKQDADTALSVLNNYFTSQVIGEINNSGKIDIV